MQNYAKLCKTMGVLIPKSVTRFCLLESPISPTNSLSRRNIRWMKPYIGRALTGAPWWCVCGTNPCSLNKFGEMFEQISFGGLSHIPGSPYWPLNWAISAGFGDNPPQVNYKNCCKIGSLDKEMMQYTGQLDNLIYF